MRLPWLFLFTCTTLIAQFSLDSFAQTRADYWPTWRGPNADGVAPKGDPPITFSETENIKWKVKLPDSGESTPIIWGDLIFLQTAIPTSEESSEGFSEEHPELDRYQQPRAAKNSVPWRFGLLCLDRKTGETLWDAEAVIKVPHARHHATASHSAFSPVTDGERVWANLGSQGLFCFDVEGNKIWEAELPPVDMYGEYGEGASPAIAGDHVVVVQDHMGESGIFAFNKLTGKLAWEQDRGSGLSAWPTPLPITVDGKVQVVISGNR